MTTTISIRDFKNVCDTLRRFADVRETAKEPRDRVVIQTAGGRLKFVAGDEDMTVVVDAGAAGPTERSKVVVGSRLLLKSAEALRGRGEIEVEVDRGAAFLHAPNGGKLTLSSMSTKVPDFVRPPKKSEAEYVVPHAGFAVASKVFPAVTSKHHPADKVYMSTAMGRLTLTGCDDRSYSQWLLAEEHWGDEEPTVSISARVFPSLVDMTEPGVIARGGDRLAIRSGRALVGVRLSQNRMPWPMPQVGEESIRVETDRAPLIDALKGMQGQDANSRVRLVASGEDLLIQNWEGNGNMSLLSDVTGRGRVGVDASRMQKLLSALPGKRVVIEFEGSRPGAVRLSTEEASGWQTLLAPVA